MGIALDNEHKRIKELEEELNIYRQADNYRNNAIFHTVFSETKTINLLLEPETGEIIEANNAALDFYGYSLDELKKMNINQINTLSEDDIKNQLKTAEEGKRNYFTFKHKLKGGEIKDVEVYSSKIVLNNKVFLFSIIHDITEKRINEQKIENQLQFQRLLTNMQSKFLETDIQDIDKAIYFSQKQICQFLGTDRSAIWFGTSANPQKLFLKYLTTLDEIPPFDENITTNDVFPWFTEQLLKNEIVAISDIEELKEKAKTDYENLKYFGDQSTLANPFSFSKNPVISGAISFAGTVSWLNWTESLIFQCDLIAKLFSNALEKKRVELELKRSNEIAEERGRLLQALFDNTSEAIGISQNGKSLLFNKAYLKLFGYDSYEELKEKSLLLQIAPGEHEKLKYYIANRYSDKSLPQYYESIGVKKNGEEFPIEIQVGLYEYNHQQYSFGIIRDITERTQLMKDLTLSKEKA